MPVGVPQPVAQPPRLGEIVDYANGRPGSTAVCRPALITDTSEWTPDEERIGLAVFHETELEFCRAIRYDAAGSPNTWHWPEH